MAIEIKIQTKKGKEKNYAYSITIGYKTSWFSQIPFIMICKEWFSEEMTVDWAECIIQVYNYNISFYKGFSIVPKRITGVIYYHSFTWLCFKFTY